ncbi:hypothetical protein FRC09_016852, partial [Ceratobasidium sp. 395]
MTPASLYSERLGRLRLALRSLPSSLPHGSNVYNFLDWTPDPEGMDQYYGTECSVLNAHLENAFGFRAISPVLLRERGPGIESLVDIMAHYLEGDCAEKPVLAKWVDDLIEAASVAPGSIPSNQVSTKRLPKPSAAQKPSNEWADTTPGEATFPAFNKTGLYLKQLFCLELEVGGIPAAASYRSDKEDVDELVATFRSQLISYARGEYPFRALSASIPSDQKA